ncbi:hypothetical protein D3C85_1460420 [compost metagenome]
MPDGLIGKIGVKSFESFQISIYYNRNRMVANHCIRFIAHQVPYRQFSLLFINRQESIDHIRYFILMKESKQRMIGPVGIP